MCLFDDDYQFDKYNKIKKYHVLHHTVVHSVFVFYTLSLLQEIGTSHRAGEKAELDLAWKCRIAPRTCSNLARAEDIPWWEFCASAKISSIYYLYIRITV